METKELRVIEILEREFPEIRNTDPDRFIGIADEIGEVFADEKIVKVHCKLCGDYAETLGDIEKKDYIKVFGRIPIKDVVINWYCNGFRPEDPICEKCLIK